MARLTITLGRNADGTTLVRVGLCPDPDDMPHEHEARHRRLVAELLPGADGWYRERPEHEAAVG
jgi:hypothetical protein